MTDILYIGWMPGNQSDIPALREHGVCGEMRFKLRDSLNLTIWQAVGKLFGARYSWGAIEHCECTEDVMEHLIKEWPGFCPSLFTGCLPPYGNDDQVPAEQQKYWDQTLVAWAKDKP